jgi:hypothetical protein
MHHLDNTWVVLWKLLRAQLAMNKLNVGGRDSSDSPRNCLHQRMLNYPTWYIFTLQQFCELSSM